jgi:hypothetical protein
MEEAHEAYELRSLPRTAVSVLPLAYLIQLAFVTLGLGAWTVVIWVTHAGGPSGHLPWPQVQAALASPLAPVALITLLALAAAWPQILARSRTMPGEYLVGSADVTGISILRWSRVPAAGSPATRVDRWLGHGRRDRALSLALATAGLLTALVCAGGWLFSLAYRLRGGPVCAQTGCPSPYPLLILWIALAAASLASWLDALPQYRFLRRVEAACGIRFRRRAWWGGLPLYYVRLPGIAPAAAVEALARFTPPSRPPRMRVWGLTLLALVPYGLALCALQFAGAWLRLQWFPG